MESSNLTPTEWKNKGNEAFKEKKYDEAIKYYSKAIELDESQSIFFSNRARCYKVQNKIDEALSDAVNAIELDEQNIKAFLLCGQLLSEQGKQGPINKIQQSISRLTKALTLCAGQQKQVFEKDLHKYIKRSKKLLWYRQREEKIQKLRQYQKKLFDLIDNRVDMDIEQKKQNKQLIQESMGDPDEPFVFEIPDYYCCSITLNFMEDPVCTAQGTTYERAALMEHFQKNGNFDPVSRKPAYPYELIPNLNLKQGIDEYLQDNSWAYEYRYNEKYQDIEF